MFISLNYSRVIGRHNVMQIIYFKADVQDYTANVLNDWNVSFGQK